MAFLCISLAFLEVPWHIQVIYGMSFKVFAFHIIPLHFLALLWVPWHFLALMAFLGNPCILQDLQMFIVFFKNIFAYLCFPWHPWHFLVLFGFLTYLQVPWLSLNPSLALLEFFANPRYSLTIFGIPWQFLVFLGNSWSSMAFNSFPWLSMIPFAFLALLATFRHTFHSLAFLGASWCFLAIPGHFFAFLCGFFPLLSILAILWLSFSCPQASLVLACSLDSMPFHLFFY